MRRSSRRPQTTSVAIVYWVVIIIYTNLKCEANGEKAGVPVGGRRSL